MYSPKLYQKLKTKGTGGTDSAVYCYSVWLRHLVLLHENGMNDLPTSIVEIGPGDSLGIGLNALITGAEKYYAFDIIEHSNIERNLKILDEIIDLYKAKVEIPHGKLLNKVKPRLENYKFPSQILSDEYLKKMLNPDRLQQIREVIKKGETGIFSLKYVLPNSEKVIIENNSIDLVYSQAVMEHIVDIDSIYNNSYNWLRPSGYMSHQIDYSAHETDKLWYGHWKYPKWLWKIILNGRLYAINRYPNSYQIKSMLKSNFRIIFQLPYLNSKAKSIKKDIFSKYEFCNEDLNTASAYIISKK